MDTFARNLAFLKEKTTRLFNCYRKFAERDTFWVDAPGIEKLINDGFND